MARNMGTAIGAIAHLPLYSTCPAGMNLCQSPIFSKALRCAERKAKEENARTPIAATAEDVDKALPLAPNDAARAMLIIAWQTTMRLGDVAQLTRDDILLSPMTAPATARSGISMRVIFRNSKTGPVIGKHTVHAFLPARWTSIVTEYIGKYTGDQALFPMTTPKLSTIKAAVNALKSVPDRNYLEARSLRRGALQTLAVMGATHEQLCHFSGHKNIASLLRYLNWGSIVGKRETELLQLNALLAPTVE